MRTLLVPLILPPVCAWVTRQQSRILEEGVALTDEQICDARMIGVQFPERVRLLRVAEVPLPLQRLSNAIGSWFNLPGKQTSGLTAGYGIFVHANRWGDRALVAHELAHTRQYERLGIRPFLKRYLRECILLGYPNAPMEHEAHECARQVCDQR